MSKEAFEKLLKNDYNPTTHEGYLISMYRRLFDKEKEIVMRESKLRKKENRVTQHERESVAQYRTNSQYSNSGSRCGNTKNA